MLTSLFVWQEDSSLFYPWCRYVARCTKALKLFELFSTLDARIGLQGGAGCR